MQDVSTKALQMPDGVILQIKQILLLWEFKCVEEESVKAARKHWSPL